MARSDILLPALLRQAGVEPIGPDYAGQIVSLLRATNERLTHSESRMLRAVARGVAQGSKDRACAAEDEAARLREALRHIAQASDMPDNWEPYNDVEGYTGYERGERHYAVDDSNSGDVHAHGEEEGCWAQAKVARTALAHTPAADRAALREKVIEAARAPAFRAYLREQIAWLDSPSLAFEANAEAFYKESGMLAPGKDAPAAMGADVTYEERRDAYRAWYERRSAPWYAAARRVLAALDAAEKETTP